MTTYRDFNEFRGDEQFTLYREDFFTFTLANWTETEVGTVTPAISTTKKNGRVDIAVPSGANNIGHYRGLAPVFFIRGKKLAAGVIASSPDFAKDASFAFGLAGGTDNLFGTTNKFLATVVDGQPGALVQAVAKTGDVALALADGAEGRFEVYYDGADAIQFYLNGQRYASFTAAQGPADNTPLYIAFGAGNTGDGAIAKNLEVDAVWIKAER